MTSEEPTRTAPPSSARHKSPYSTREKVARMLWAMVQGTLFRCSFHTWYGWRRFLLRRFGATIAPTAHIRRTVRVECPWNLTVGENSALGDGVIAYCLGAVRIGDRVSISQYAHLCAGNHDYTKSSMPLIRPTIDVHDDVWIAAEAFVGPGVTIGAGAILGARAAAFGDVQPWMIYGGNPARAIKPRDYEGRPATA